MKLRTTTVAAALALAAMAASAQQKGDDMKGMDMKEMDMKGMDMKGMDMGGKPAAVGQVHHAKGTVKKVDAKAGIVTLQHGPVASLNWPSMSMNFRVKDKKVMGKLGPEKNVEVDFVKDGNDFVITAVK